MKLQDKLILVLYIDIRPAIKNGSDVDDYIRNIITSSSEYLISDDVLLFYIPIEGDGRIDCINPKLVDEKAFNDAKIKLDECKAIVDRFIKKDKNEVK